MRTRYAVQALLHLSMNEGSEPILIQDIAEKQGIPLKYLQQILVALKMGGFVVSRRGPGGGYLLGSKPEKIALGEVVRALEGPQVNSGPEDGLQAGALKETMVRARKAFTDVLDRTTFAELRDRQRLLDAAFAIDFVI